MGTKTIPQLNAASSVNLTDVFEIDQGAGSVKATQAQILSLGSENITSGVSPVNADNTKQLTIITSGGSAGNENVILPNFTLDVNGINAEKNGVTHTFILGTQTNPSDVVRIYADSAIPVIAVDTAGSTTAITNSNGVVLNLVDHTAMFVWQDYQWFFNNGSYNNSTLYTSKSNLWLNTDVFVGTRNLVDPITGLSGGPFTLDKTASGFHYTNIGGGALEFNLGTPVAPTILLQYTFTVLDVGGIKINSFGTGKIRIGDSLVSNAGGFAQSTTLGSSLTLISTGATSASDWVATAVTGTWTVG